MRQIDAPNYEVIVVNDGSTDETAEAIVEEVVISERTIAEMDAGRATLAQFAAAKAEAERLAAASEG